MKEKNNNWSTIILGLAILAIFMRPSVLFTQVYDLETCIDMAVKNHPLNGKYQNISDAHALQVRNTKSELLPVLDINAQATYQDPTIEVEMGLPNINFPSPSNDQYKAWLDIKQTIYDGGITKKSIELEHQKGVVETLSNNVDIDKIKQVVSDLYFGVLMIDLQIEQATLLYKEIGKRIETSQSLMKQGVILQSNFDGLVVAQLQQEQKIIGLKGQKKGVINMLELYIDNEMDSVSANEQDQTAFYPDTVIKRKELELFKANQQQLILSSELLKNSRRPKVFAFSQVGYGNPGLNMLNDEFDPYYIIGAGLNWKIHDWKKTDRKVRVMEIQQSNIELARNTFELHVEAALVKLQEEINTGKEIITKGETIIEKYEILENIAASQFENGTLNATDYLMELNKKRMAVVLNEIQKIKMQQAVINYKLLTGKI